MRALAGLAAIAMLGVALFYPLSLRAEPAAYQATDGQVQVTIFPEACTAKVEESVEAFAATAINDDGSQITKQDFRLSKVLYRGKEHAGCWVFDEDIVYVLNEDNSILLVPVKAFRPLEMI